MKTINVDLSKKWNIFQRKWQFCIGNDHAYQMHRKDMFEQIKYIHDELGFKYIRFHGIFDDDMLIYQKMNDYRAMRGLVHTEHIREINFRQVGDVYHNVIDAGFKPFVELSFMPSVLAKGKKKGFKYQNNICMPKNFKKWKEFIKEFINFLINEFTLEEIKTWYFEIWNEPDLGIFFNGKQKDYFKLYKETVDAIKEVCPSLRVGGPSTSACRWLPEFINFCNENNVPCDFVTTHHYTGDGFGNMLTVKNALKMFPITKKSAKNGTSISDTLKECFFYPEILKKWEKGAFNKMDQKALDEAGDIPLFITEWNSMAVFGSPVHDEKYSSAFALKTSLDVNQKLSGISFWCASDIFEEMLYLQGPFIGSYGIVTQDNIAKPNFWAFKILNMLYDLRLESKITNEEVEYAVFKKDDHHLQVVVYNQDLIYEKDEMYDFEVCLPSKIKKAFEYRIDDNHCNPKKEWQKLGSPKNLTKKQISDIKEKTALKAEKTIFTDNKISSSIHTNDIVLYEIEI